MPTLPREEQMKKLPKWAQAHIEALVKHACQLTKENHQLKQMDNKCTAGETNIWVDHEHHNQQYISDRSRVRFIFNKEHEWRSFIEMKFQDYRPGIKMVQIYAGDTIRLLPHSANMAYVQLVPHNEQ